MKDKFKPEDITTMWECDLKEKIYVLSIDPKAIHGLICRSSRYYYWKHDGATVTISVIDEIELDKRVDEILNSWSSKIKIKTKGK